jgi:DNA transformation protein
MSVSKEYVEYILDLLSPLGQVETSRMFSGVLLKIRGRQLGILFAERLYFKVIDTALQEKYRVNGSLQFSYKRKDKKYPVIIKNWWSVPDEAMDDGEELVRLAQEVLSQNSSTHH